MGLAVAVFIFVSGLGVLRDTLNPLLGEAPSQEMTEYIARKVLSYEGAVSYTHLDVYKRQIMNRRFRMQSGA